MEQNASFSRNNPSSSPTLSMWKLEYVGQDTVPPRTYLDEIDGTKGLNEWYTSESVIIWLHAEDFPTDTGSGVDKTYYKINNGQTQEYSPGNGIQLSATQESNWMGEFEIQFWSVDKQGNAESDEKPENNLIIKIDAEPPYVEITEPADEQKVEVPFWLRADATDNAGVSRVEFDIEPFGEREGLPYVDNEPPYEWYCDVDEPDNGKSKDIHTVGVNVMVRAQAFDESGQTWLHEVWVYVENWDEISKVKPKVTMFDRIDEFFSKLDIGFRINKVLNINVDTDSIYDKAVFSAQKILTKKTYTSVDTNHIDGCSASFNVPTGFYKISSDIYKDNKIISSNILSRVLFIKI